MAERSSRVVGMRMPVDEYESLRALAAAEKRTLGGLALELMRNGRMSDPVLAQHPQRAKRR